MTLFRYGSLFFDFVEASSTRSASKFVSLIDFGFSPKSILDVGCARGSWLAQWKKIGLEVHGLDGSYLDVSSLLISIHEFTPVDISSPFNLGRKFDIVECLEVAEHVDAEKADCLIQNLVNHSDIVLFSAAQPGQGGENHVNEKPLKYWAEKFLNHGYQAYDYPRDVIMGFRDIEPWYRYNMILFANTNGKKSLSKVVISHLVKPQDKFKDLGSPLWKLTCFFIKFLPRFIVDFLARLKHLFTNIKLKFQQEK